ncbi:Tom6p NDAI_0F00710 [Naumovozyma dairenensis CBS 421]|uniref:Uncharacterized protein n=1 Tax=Naumovozyma dairenensis (strain ATCC 10597 / BCRC 20456 / CBS 421 / NBRC 0211 / NRRL Y-12639) TaxID=1071378 RepID=G0WC79_NAUDC|nr:hypothetical protein NDAI_0F00710 [Naumovozyma dairenensis CBS 421]CCD25390.1 hypothetical protein NDAI_0F00710 [Naumovozyma dairenensis CBS 421]
MSGPMFGMPGMNPTGATIGTNNGVPSNKSRFQQFKESPAFTVLLNGTLFVAGVTFIQSPLMDMLAPAL